MKEVGASDAPCLPLLQLHYLSQCKKYPEVGGVLNTQCQCIFLFCVFFSCWWQKPDNSVSDHLSSILFSHQVLLFFSVHTTSPFVRFW